MANKIKWNDSIFRQNDIRGVYKQDFDLDFVECLGQSFVQLAHQHKKTSLPLRVAVAYDSRLSGPEIARSLAKALSTAGAEVCFLGMVPTPVCFFASHFFSRDISASIMVTASHNPVDFNGFKFSLYKHTLCGPDIIKLKTLVQKSHFPKAKHKGQIIPLSVSTAYVEFMKKHFNTMNVGDDKNIAIDCGNGASGFVAKQVCQALNVRSHWLYETPDGRFPNHHPDPSIDHNLEDLQSMVVKHKLRFGVALDGDGDRLVIIGNTGKIFYGDELMSVFISDIVSDLSVEQLKHAQKQHCIVADVKCAPWFFEFIEQKISPIEGKWLMWKSGHSLIRQKTLETQAIFGGEFSGHFFFCDKGYFLDDGMYGSLRFMQILCKNPHCAVEDILPIKHSVDTNEIRVPIDNTDQAYQQLHILKNYYNEQKTAQLSTIDGVRVHIPKKAWGLVRLSNTQKMLTLRFGGRSKEELQKIQTDFYQLLKLQF